MTRHSEIRPSQFAVLLIASGDSLPRTRARDQQADLAGNQLKQRLLARIIEIDPEPDDLLTALTGMVNEFGDPPGPTRALARLIWEEWDSARTHQDLSKWLLSQAIQVDQDGSQ
jgi:hypothetical protein